MLSEIDSVVRKQAVLQQNLRVTSDEAKRLQTIISNFDRDSEAIKDKPDLVKNLELRAQPFKNRLASIQPNIEKMQKQLADLDVQAKAMQEAK